MRTVKYVLLALLLLFVPLHGSLTSPILGEAFKLPYKDLDILLAAF